jgi:glycosyltransferase involved in cell wall biosynthesis
MRVLVVHNRYRGDRPSGENVLADIEARLLEEHGCRVERLVVSSDDISDWPMARKALLPARVVWSLEGYRITADAIQSFRPDVVHVHNTFPLLSPSALWAGKGSAVPVILTLHNFRPICAAGGFVRNGRICEECLGRLPVPAIRHGCYRASRAATFPLALMSAVHDLAGTWTRCVDTLVVPSEFARGMYLRAGWPPTKLTVKYHSVPEPGLRRRGPGSGFVCLARLDTDKGVDVLLRAWSEAFPHGEERLLVLGSGTSEAALRRAAHARQGIEFHGHVERSRALQLLAGARALVVPTRSYETFGLTLIESYSLGVPVIASRIGALREIVEVGRTGFLVAPDHPGELASALASVAASPDLSIRLGQGARSAYEARFHPDRTTESLLAIYRRAVGVDVAS